MSTVLHLSEGTTGKKSELLGNVSNLHEERPEEEIVAVLNGNAVEMLVEDADGSEYVKDQLEFADFKACSNSIENRDLEEENLLEGVEVVNAAVSELARLQSEGFSYIKV